MDPVWIQLALPLQSITHRRLVEIRASRRNPANLAPNEPIGLAERNERIPIKRARKNATIIVLLRATHERAPKRAEPEEPSAKSVLIRAHLAPMAHGADFGKCCRFGQGQSFANEPVLDQC